MHNKKMGIVKNILKLFMSKSDKRRLRFNKRIKILNYRIILNEIYAEYLGRRIKKQSQENSGLLKSE